MTTLAKYKDLLKIKSFKIYGTLPT